MGSVDFWVRVRGRWSGRQTARDGRGQLGPATRWLGATTDTRSFHGGVFLSQFHFPFFILSSANVIGYCNQLAVVALPSLNWTAPHGTAPDWTIDPADKVRDFWITKWPPIDSYANQGIFVCYPHHHHHQQHRRKKKTQKDPKPQKNSITNLSFYRLLPTSYNIII